MSELQHKYGWIPDLPDARDFKYAAPAHIVKALPTSVDLRPVCPVVYNQGSLGSCSACAIGAAHQFGQKKQQAEHDFIPSRLFLYYNERVMEDSINYDSGAYLRDGMKSAAKEGICPETMWPYDIEKFTQRPPTGCYIDALDNQVVTYWSVRQSVDQLRGCLADGYPVVFGFTVYSSFESNEVTRTGEAPMPGSEDRVLGGHAVLMVGYDDATQRFLCRNSWGEGWGKAGYFTLPYAYVTNPDLAADFWTIRLVELDTNIPTPQPDPEPQPDPQPNSPCSLPGLLPAVKAFTVGVLEYNDKLKTISGTPNTALMFESGIRSLNTYIERVQKLQEHGKI